MVEIYIKTKDYLGNDSVLRINERLAKNLDMARKRVIQKNYDYPCVISGLPRIGKSSLARVIAKYCDKNFTVKNIAFTGDEFIHLTNNIPDNSAVILDESFADMNTSLSKSPEFVRIVNHMQIIGQKNLFLILVLPNFFDLSKKIALYRVSHLFVVEEKNIEGDRGKFRAFDRTAKDQLYIRGSKYVNYYAYPDNFSGLFDENTHLFDMQEYNRLKREHLLKQSEILQRKDVNLKQSRDKILWKLYKFHNWDMKSLIKLSELEEKWIYKLVKAYGDQYGDSFYNETRVTGG